MQKLDTKIMLFADDVKIFRKTNNFQDCERLQEILSEIDSWSNSWQLMISAPKCVVLHSGPKNHKFTYKLGLSDLP